MNFIRCWCECLLAVAPNLIRGDVGVNDAGIHSNGSYMESCVFVCADFPKENRKLANEQLTLIKHKTAIFYILCWQIVIFLNSECFGY